MPATVVKGFQQSDVSFFGALRTGAFQCKFNASYTSGWKVRWCALHKHQLAYYDRKPQLPLPRLCIPLARDVAVRLHRESDAAAAGGGLLFSLSLGGAVVARLRMQSIDELVQWGDACEAAGARVDRDPEVG